MISKETQTFYKVGSINHTTYQGAVKALLIKIVDNIDTSLPLTGTRREIQEVLDFIKEEEGPLPPTNIPG